MSAVVLDIEGTTTPVTFVYDVLFPYARQHVADFLRERWDSAEVQACAAQFAEQVRVDGYGAPVAGNEAQQRLAVLSNALVYMDADRKVTCLKTLQGLVWRAGYLAGALQGAVFEDVPPALRQWQQAQTGVYIYSSGSVEAQQLLFRHSACGDLTPWLRGYFDTTTGPKREADSYRRIAEAIGELPAAITFVTDVVAEAQAAHEAGLVAVVMHRPDHPAPSPHPFREVSDLRPLVPS